MVSHNLNSTGPDRSVQAGSVDNTEVSRDRIEPGRPDGIRNPRQALGLADLGPGRHWAGRAARGAPTLRWRCPGGGRAASRRHGTGAGRPVMGIRITASVTWVGRYNYHRRWADVKFVPLWLLAPL